MLSWDQLRLRYHIPSHPVAGSFSEMMALPDADIGRALIVENYTAAIPARPNLFTIIYHRINDRAALWIPDQLWLGDSL